jgi:hypothetical protein
VDLDAGGDPEHRDGIADRREHVDRRPVAAGEQ